MEKKEILNFVEDKDIEKKTDWYLHATRDDLETIKKILNEGIKCAHLMNKKGNHFNGKYYISLYKGDNDGLNNSLAPRPKLVIEGITPYHADRSKLWYRRPLINTRSPLRTSEWDGEYQQYLRIDPSHFVALEYSLSYLLTRQNELTKEKIQFLIALISYLDDQDISLPIFDFSSSKEINKKKVLSLDDKSFSK